MAWPKEPARHSLAAKGVKTGSKTFYEKWPHPGPREAKRLAELREIIRKEEQRARRRREADMDRVRTERRMALRLADEVRSNLIVGGEVGVLVDTAVDHLREGDYEGAYAAFASAREEASEDEPLPGIADDLREYEIRARNLQGR